MTPQDYGLCTDRLDPILDEQCIWIVTLCDDTKVYQNENAKYVPEFLAELEHSHSPWVRLGAYLRDADLEIVRWQLQFRKSNIVPLKTAELGYVYSRGMIGSMSVGTENANRTTQHFHITGTIDKPNQRVVDRAWHHSPSLVHSETKTTPLVDVDPSMIIWRKGVDKPSF
jgi:hypothetical protein